jgi:hypothetical protein
MFKEGKNQRNLTYVHGFCFIRKVSELNTRISEERMGGTYDPTSIFSQHGCTEIESGLTIKT